MIEVRLAEHEIVMAAGVGVRRQAEALAKGLPDKHGFEGEGFAVHIDGALGELAVAKATNRFWNGSVSTFKAGGDVGRIQVRTRSKDWYDLIVRRDDRDDDAFVLVTGRCPVYKVWGWIRGADAKREAFLQTHGDREAAWFVPKDALVAIRTTEAVAA